MRHYWALIIAVLFSTGSALAQPVASISDGLLFLPEITASEPQVVTQAITATPSFLDDVSPASFPQFASDPFGSSLRILSSLFALIILAFILSWFLQKKGGIGGNVFGKVLGILPLDSRRLIYLVDVMGRVLILGVTDNNISLLCEITDKATLDSLRLQYDKPSPGMEKLFSFLKGGRSKDNQQEEEQPAPLQATERTDDRIRKLNDLLVKRKQTDSSDQN